MKTKRIFGSRRVPFLLRLSTAQRALQPSPPQKVAYDHDRGLTVHLGSGDPVVRDSAFRPLMTKKEDIEKGEDRKGLWI